MGEYSLTEKVNFSDVVFFPKRLWFIIAMFLFFFSSIKGVMCGSLSSQEIANHVKDQYKGFFSYSLIVTFSSSYGEGLKARCWQNGNSGGIIWSTKPNGTEIKSWKGQIRGGYVSKDSPFLPFCLGDFVSPYKMWQVTHVDVMAVSYDYVDHIPCVVIGNLTNRVYVDIENFVVRKRVIDNIEYTFKKFVHLGNYFLPTEIEIRFEGQDYTGEIFWEDINKSDLSMEEMVQGNKIGDPDLVKGSPILRCLPMASDFFK